MTLPKNIFDIENTYKIAEKSFIETHNCLKNMHEKIRLYKINYRKNIRIRTGNKLNKFAIR